MSEVAIVVIAKEPVAGRAKTRLSPPCSPAQAARLAEAALADTLAVVAETPAARRVIALDGEPGAWLPPGFEVVPQVGGDLGRRLGAALVAVGGAVLLVGMDTPQLTRELLDRAAGSLLRPGIDAVLGAAEDGGYWCIGLRAPDARVFEGVPMSTAATGEAQRRRLHALGLRVAELPPLRDVDSFADARVVARCRPDSRFALAVAEVEAAA